MRALIRVFVLWFATLTVAAAAETYLTEEQALKTAIPGAERVEKKWGVFDPAAVAKLGSLKPPRAYDYFVGYRGQEVVGYARIDERIGKTLPITFIIGLDPALKVRLVEIMAYRESHGGEVRQPGFRAQFAGKGVTDALKVGQDVQNIAGATLSCRAISDGVRHNVAFLTALVEPAKAPAAPEAKPAAKAGTKTGAGLFRRNRVLMGTALEIQVYAPSRGTADVAIEAAFARVDALERLLSHYRKDSEISHLANARRMEFVPLSPDTHAVLTAAEAMRRRSGGAFDVNWKHPGTPLRLEAGGTHGGIQIDLGAIGKGYALDAAAGVLKEHGIDSALLNFGGQLLAVGRRSWPVAVTGDGANVIAHVALANASISTSATDQQGAHIVDPRTGRPVTGMRSATVVTRRATDADALSTALFVLGTDAGGKLAKKDKIAAMLVAADGRTLKSAAWPR